MNDDLILRARLHQQEVEKAIPQVLGRETNPIANLARAARTGTSYSQAKAAGEQKRGARFQNKRMAEDIKNLAAGTPTAMSQASTAGMAQQDAEGQSLDPAATVADKGEVANVAAEAAKRAAAAPAPAAPPAAPTPPAASAPAAPPAPATNVVATDGTQPAAAGQAAAAPAATPGLNPQVQGMAQQFQAGQDMQTLQQGKGAEPQTYMKNRSLMGKIMDVGTLGLTSQFGATGGIARRRANQQAAQQTQQYDQAQSRMNQRAMGMSPVMTSFDSPSSAYQNLGDMIAIRKGIQERNTTDNLRRW